MSINSPGFSIIGCGRVGVCLSVFLEKSGFAVAGFFSRSESSAEFARKMTGTGQVYPDALSAVKAGAIVFITTPDTQIQPVCESLAQAGAFRAGQTVFHLSGALSSDILRSAADAGAGIGSIHPLQAFAPYEEGQANPFEGINMSVEGDPEAVALGHKIVTALAAWSFAIPTEAKTLYHASAVVASNYLVTLEHFALQLLMETGLEEARAYEILEPLIQGTLANIKARGTVAALTGPVARGDDEIVSRHLRDIDRQRPEFSRLYRLLGRHTLAIAGQGAGLNKVSEEKLSRLLSDPS